MNPKVDAFISNAKKWQPEMEQLRRIALDCDLTEELKWGRPCYSFRGVNILIIGGLKTYCVLSFLKGVLLQDAAGLLDSPGENSQSVRYFRFTIVAEILEKKATISAYIYEAIEVEKEGLKVDFKSKNELVFPSELLQKFKVNPAFKTAFKGLTPGRQRAYNLFFTAAKQSKTRETRIEKYVPRILDGKGINDCICGLSKRMPQCDGSHKFLEK